MKVLHIITGLSNGGAEGVLYRLCKHDNQANHSVVSMVDQKKYKYLNWILGFGCLVKP